MRANSTLAMVGLQKVTYIAYALILVFEVLSGPLRFILDGIGLAFLAYLPKVVALVALLYYLLAVCDAVKRIFVIAAVAVLSIVSLALGASIQEVLFGIWIYEYVAFGVVLFVAFGGDGWRISRLSLFALFVVIFGVLLNNRVTFPWAGHAYMIGGVEVEGAREWQTFDVDRIAGFSRSSTNAAAQVASLLPLALAYFGRRSPIFSHLLILLAIIAALVTTSKSVVGALAIVWAVYLLKGVRPLASGVALCSALVGVLVPFSTLFVSYKLNLNSWISQVLFLSFEERLLFTWPISIDLIGKYGSSIFGRGIGGVGGAQKMFGTLGPGTYDLSYTDNVGLYLYGTFGIFGVLLILFMIFRACVAFNAHDYRRGPMFFYILTFLSVVLVGAAVDVLEAGLGAVSFGFGVAALLSKGDGKTLPKAV